MLDIQVSDNVEYMTTQCPSCGSSVVASPGDDTGCPCGATHITFSKTESVGEVAPVDNSAVAVGGNVTGANSVTTSTGDASTVYLTNSATDTPPAA